MLGSFYQTIELFSTFFYTSIYETLPQKEGGE